MNKYTQMLGIVLALNMETLAIFLGCWYFGEWLDEKYPTEIVKWHTVTLGFSLFAIVFSWYNFLKVIRRLMEGKSSDTSKPKGSKE